MNNKTQVKGSYFVRIAVILLMAAALCGATGCRDTDVLKEIIYDQSSDIVDPDPENKFLISDSTSDIESPLVSAVEISDEAPAEDEEQNLVVYGSKPNISDMATKESIYDMTPSFKGLEASKGVTFVLSDDEDAIEYEVEEEDETEESTDEATVDVATEDGSESDEGEDGESDSDDSGDTNSDEGEPAAAEGEEGGTDGGSVTVKNTKGKYAKTPNVTHIAAFGELAVIVQSIGGEGALVAADAETLDGKFSDVFADEGAADIVEGWSDDGDTIANIDIDAIIDSGAETILCYDSSYYDSLTSKQIQKLNDAGISFTLVYKLTNSTGLKSTVTTVGNMLSEAEGIGQEGNTVANAEAYVSFHDDLVSTLLGKNDNKLVSANSKTYESNNSKSYSYTSDAQYTLLIDGYDANATYSYTTGTFSPKSDGALLASLGYKSRTTSYYMQVGGVINNAAARYSSSADGKQMIVWQFPTAQLSFKKANWSYSSGSLLSSAWFPSQHSGWSYTLLTTDVNSGTSSDYSAMAGASPGSSFGTGTFPTVITTTQDAKDALVKNMGRSKGLYTPYEIASEEDIAYSAFGISNGKLIIFSTIGVDGLNAGNKNKLADYTAAQLEGLVLVNPCGLFSEWTDGDSMEAVLESAWVYDEVNTDSGSGFDYWDYVEEFYETFYRYSLTGSDEADILDGE